MPALIPLAVAAGGAIYNHYANPDDGSGGTSGNGTLLSAGLTTAASIYGAGRQSDAQLAAAGLQTNAANHAADMQAQATARALDFQKQQAENDFRNQLSVQRANYQQYLTRVSAARTLGQSLGFDIGEAKPFTEPTDPNYTGTSATGPDDGSFQAVASGTPPPGGKSLPAGTSGSPGGTATALQQLVRSGLDPQTAAAQFNKQYGRTTGNEAVYYPGTNTIGLPEGYLSGNDGWGFIARGPGGSGGGTLGALTGLAPAAATITPLASQPGTLAPPGYQPFQPGTLGAVMGMR